jgi:hypothetical protein
MRIFLCACLLLAGCGLGDEPVLDLEEDRAPPIAAELAHQAELQQSSDIMQRNEKEVERLLAEGKAAGIENQVQAAVNRLIIASNAIVVSEGDLRAAKWYEQQVTGKTPAELIAAFPEQ